MTNNRDPELFVPRRRPSDRRSERRTSRRTWMTDQAA